MSKLVVGVHLFNAYITFIAWTLVSYIDLQIYGHYETSHENEVTPIPDLGQLWVSGKNRDMQQIALVGLC